MATPEQSASPDAAAPLGTVIHRKAQAGRAEHQARAMSLAKALRLTIAKVADTMFDMSMGVIGARRATCGGENLSDPLQMDGLRMLFDGPERNRAAIILDADMVAALIQQQTMGKVLPDAGNAPRRLTATDAAVCAPFLETVLKQAALLAQDPDDQQVITGYQYGVWAEDARILGMALDAQDYDLIHLDVDISGGVRQGHIFLCMPKSEPQQAIPDPGAEQLGLDEGATPASALLSDTVMNIEAEVRICLAQTKMSLRNLGQLDVGSLLELEQARFDRVGIQTIAGKTLARGILGQLEGQRAVQVQAARSAANAMFSAGQGEKPLALGLPGEDGENMSDLSTMENLSGTDLPDLTDIADMPELPDLPDMGGLDGLPDLTDLPELPDLSDLND